MILEYGADFGGNGAMVQKTDPIIRGLPRVQYDALRRSQRGLDEN